ncbi:tyrosine-type recombinase/integrase [Eubacterium oxidoreducens]|uniref:Site-specific recombinase XerD n=1 Tax=Eubacterium oxidoreducens TaxID=1732 RepID=A0A1G6B4D2_EUBOX|nr:site-specific integrase [Eubacterium oxidoreducens]SDB15432.1 Site-specific recombinase XerD [Eubacterium oxidoreducens]
MGDYDRLEAVKSMYRKLEKEAIISNYTLPKKPSKDGYYRVNVTDATKKRTTISAKSIEKLKEKLYLHEKGMTKTFKEMFELFEERRLKWTTNKDKRASVINTIQKEKSEYKRFFSGTEFENLPMEDITKEQIEEIVYLNLKKHLLRKKGFHSLKGILRMTFRFAYEEYVVRDNVFERVNFQKFNNMIQDEIPIKDRCHTDKEIKLILDKIKWYYKNRPYYVPAYALEFQILTGLRRGEIPPLRWSDIDETSIHIAREQITLQKVKGIVDKRRFQIVPHTKTYKDRNIVRFDVLDEFLKRLKEMQNRFYPNSEFLFPDDRQEMEVITNETVYKLYSRICKKCGIKISKDLIKGTHSFRRNAVTRLLNESGGNTLLASSQFGHSAVVAMKHYYTGMNEEKAREMLNKAHEKI